MDKRILTGDVKQPTDQAIIHFLFDADYQAFTDWLQTINKRSDLVHVADMAQQHNASWRRWSDVQRRLACRNIN